MLLFGGLLALILIPYFLIGAPVEAWAAARLADSSETRWAAGGIILLLLSSDVLFPVPSSIVSTAAGALFGLAGGFLLNLGGMTLSCLLAYWLGSSRWGSAGARRLVGAAEKARMERAAARYGDWAVAIFRAVPVLAEAAVLLAGLSRMPLRRYVLITSLANAGVSLVYALVGAYAADVNSFVLAFLGAMLLPGLALLVSRIGGPPATAREP